MMYARPRQYNRDHQTSGIIGRRHSSRPSACARANPAWKLKRAATTMVNGSRRIGRPLVVHPPRRGGRCTVVATIGSMTHEENSLADQKYMAA